MLHLHNFYSKSSVCGKEDSNSLSRTADKNFTVWKKKESDGSVTEYDLNECNKEKLESFLSHCKEMLYNSNPRQPGRITLINITQQQIRCCKAELLVRWLKNEKSYSYQNCYDDIKTLLEKNSSILSKEQINSLLIGQIMDGIPQQFETVPVNLVLQACVYSLGIFDKSHITLGFITSLGLYLTQKEMSDPLLKPVDNSQTRFDIIKKIEHLPSNIKLHTDPHGLSYAEFHSLCHLKKDKYENLSTPVLKLLSEKILYLFIERCESQSKIWLDFIQILSNKIKVL